MQEIVCLCSFTIHMKLKSGGHFILCPQPKKWGSCPRVPRSSCTPANEAVVMRVALDGNEKGYATFRYINNLRYTMVLIAPSEAELQTLIYRV